MPRFQHEWRRAQKCWSRDTVSDSDLRDGESDHLLTCRRQQTLEFAHPTSFGEYRHVRRRDPHS